MSAFVSLVHCCAVWQGIHANVRKVGASDNIIPVAVVTVSAPGHMYHYLESIRYIRLVASHLGLDKFGLMGHSMGAGMASLFAATYPEMVEALVMIDLVKPVGRRTEDIVERTREAIDTFLSIDKKLSKGSERVYKSEEEAFDRLQEGARFGSHIFML